MSNPTGVAVTEGGRTGKLVLSEHRGTLNFRVDSEHAGHNGEYILTFCSG
jgi:hypothetical protein